MHRRNLLKALPALALLACTPTLRSADFTAGPGWLEFPAGKGPGAGKHVVLLAGDEEYRSEESMPMLARILAEKHGFRCTVLFSHDDGVINPNNQKSLGRPEALDSADLLVLGLRFRSWNADALARFDAALKRGVPMVATRTSTHAFSGIPTESPQAWYNWNAAGGFGRKVLGESWVSHWGRHKFEACRTAVEPGAEGSPLLNGVGAIFADTDVYEAYPPADAKVLLRGLVLKGMSPSDEPSAGRKKRSTDKQEQGVNEPAMAVAWTREVPNAAGGSNRIFTTTMASASDLADEGLRRLVVNAVFWGLKLDVPARADVTPVVQWKPSKYSFNAFHKGLRAEAFAGVLPDPAPAAPAKKK
jgi:hypothetical protein